MADSKLLNTSSSASPPPNCAICLGSCSNKCFSDTCMHQFCFNCLLQWSKIKAECPLCKQPFKSIIHNVKSNEEYEEHIVEQPLPAHLLDNDQFHLILPHSPPTPRHHRFHFRTTFTVNTHGENAIQRMLMSHSLTNGITISNYLPHSSHSIRPRRRARCTTTNFRRSIYDSNLWASVHSDPMSMTMRFREITPEFFRANPQSRTRLVPWLNRELNALLHENTQDVMEVVDTIMDYLLRYHICSRPFRVLLRSYLNNRTDHFVHEFYNFMRSPFDMIGYDRHVNYFERPTTPIPSVDISEDDDSDVMIIEENPEVIEVHSSDSDDVIMTSSFVPKPRILPERSTSRRSRRVSVSSSSSNEEQRREDGRPRKLKLKRRRREERDSRPTPRASEHHPDGNESSSTDSIPLLPRVSGDLTDGDGSSSSVLDDVPLAKYMRIKASIGKKLLKKSSAKAKAKSKDGPTDRIRKSHPRKESPKKMRTAETASCSTSKPHSSNFHPRRRNSSASSSSSSSSKNHDCESRNRRNPNESSSSSSNHTLKPRFSYPKRERNNNVEAAPRPSQTRSDRHALLRSLSLIPQQGPSNISQIYTPSIRGQSAFQSTSNILPTPVPDEPIDYTPNTYRSNRHSDSLLSNAGKPKVEMLNHCRSAPVTLQPDSLYAENRAGPSSSYPSNSYFEDLQRRYNCDYQDPRNSPDLIDLSVTSRIRHEHPMTPSCVGPDFRSKYTPSVYFDPCALGAHQSSAHRSPNISMPSTSYAPYNFDSVPTNSALKSEPSYSEYQSEGSTKYWTDLSTQTTSHTNSNDSSYNNQSQQPRKSVIQNSRDNSVPQDEIISPRWSSSNSPSYPCYPENWSDCSVYSD